MSSATTYADDQERRRQAGATRAPGSGTQRASEHPLLRLQRQIGNRATVAYLSGRVIQRATPPVEYEEEEGVEKSVDATELISGQMTTWSNLGTLHTGTWKAGNANTGTTGAGMAGSILTVGTDLFGAISSGRQATKSKKLLDQEREAGRGKEATARVANRGYKSSVADTTQSSGDLASQGVTITSQVSTFMANAGSHTAFAGANNLIGGVGGIIALPFQALSTLRTGRKAVKQYNRFRKLRENVEDPKTSSSKATKALEKQKEALRALQATKQHADQELTDARGKYFEARQQLLAAGKSKKKRRKANPEKYRRLVEARRELVTNLEDLIEEAEQEVTKAEEAKAEAQDALEEYAERARDGKETAADIRAYAMRKNKSGAIKKLIGTVGGMVGVGGGIAATIAAFAAAGSTVLLTATPIGWALCGAAAVVGLALAGYAFWKWASKRYDRLVNTGGAEKGFKTWVKAINPFYKKIPSSRRQHMATRLYEVAAGATGGTTADAAHKVIVDLGLKWDKLHMAGHKESSIKLIYDKMAS